MSRRWSEDRVIQLYQEGKSYKEIVKIISSEYGVDVASNTIAQFFCSLRKKGVNIESAVKQDEKVEIKVEGDDEKIPELIDKGDHFIVFTKKIQVVITKEKLKELKLLYCLGKQTINTICTKLNYTRKEFHAIKTAFGITKDDVPVTDEELEDIESAVEKTLQEKKRMFTQKMQEKEYQLAIKENQVYKTKEYWLDKIKNITGEIKPLDIPSSMLDFNSETEALLCLADWHTGMQTDNHWNVFNFDVLTKRVIDIADKTIIDLKLYKPNVLHVMNLADLLHGLIHTSTRVEAEFNVMEQVKKASDLLCTLLEMLIGFVPEIRFYNTYGNHSRFTSNKKDALDTENFELLIPEIMQKLFIKNENIKHIKNEIDEQWMIADIKGNLIIGTHGDRDKVKKAPSNITMMYKKPYMIVSGHGHHVEQWTEHSVYSHMVGSLAGVETFAKDLRLTSKPSQSLYVFNEKGCIHQHVMEVD